MDRQGDDWEKAMSPPLPPPTQYPYLPWRIMSSTIMGVTGLLSRGFLYGLNSVEVTGLDKFLTLLESRRDPRKRQRGLITGITPPLPPPSPPPPHTNPPPSLQPRQRVSHPPSPLPPPN